MYKYGSRECPSLTLTFSRKTVFRDENLPHLLRKRVPFKSSPFTTAFAL